LQDRWVEKNAKINTEYHYDDYGTALARNSEITNWDDFDVANFDNDEIQESLLDATDSDDSDDSQKFLECTVEQYNKYMPRLRQEFMDFCNKRNGY
jgi:hypothetical protein